MFGDEATENDLLMVENVYLRLIPTNVVGKHVEELFVLRANHTQNGMRMR